MLTRFEVKGFKSLVDVAVDLGAVNVFIGANGSGKSNLLEALGFFGSMASGNAEYEAYRFRGVRPGDPESFICQFPNRLLDSMDLYARDDRTEYRLRLHPDRKRGWEILEELIHFDDKIILERSESGAIIRKGDDPYPVRNGNPSPSKTISSFVRLYFAFNKDFYQPDITSPNIPFVNADFFDRLTEYAIYAPSTPQLRGFPDDIHRDPLGLCGSDLAKALEEMAAADPTMIGPFDLDDVMDLIEWADGIMTNSVDRPSDSPVRLQFNDRYMLGQRNAISATEASEGALYVLFLLALVGHERSPRMFAVDNFDQALHPRLARALTESICDQILADGTRQMFATTHNPLVLNGLNLLDDRIRLFTVDRDAAGASKIERVVVTEQLMAKAEEGFSLSELWTMGRLRGVPQNY